MKTTLKFIFYNKFIAKILLRHVLNLNTLTSKLSGDLAIILNNGVHPKHKIIKYKEWFIDNINNEWVVLDIGSNTGLIPELMSQKAEYVYGIEIDKNHVEIARRERKKNNIEYICADATKYDYASCRAIDCVTLSNVLEHIDDRIDFLKKISSHIIWKNKKRFLIRVPLIDRDWLVLFKKELGLQYKLDNTHYIEYTFEQFERELLSADIYINRYHIKFGEIYAICEARN